MKTNTNEILGYIKDHPGCTVEEIAIFAGYASRPSLSRRLQGYVAKGMLTCEHKGKLGALLRQGKGAVQMPCKLQQCAEGKAEPRELHSPRVDAGVEIEGLYRQVEVDTCAGGGL